MAQIKPDILSKISDTEYYSNEQAYESIDKKNSLQILGRFEGLWDGEVDDAVRNAKKICYHDRGGDHNDYLYLVYNLNNYPVLDSMATKMGFEIKKYKAQIQMQLPGCLMSVHVDPKWKWDLMYPGYQNRCVQVLIMLTDWEPGQLLGFDNKILTNWDKGDIIYCDYLTTYHYTANCSAARRPLLQISGVANQNLLANITNKEFRILSV